MKDYVVNFYPDPIDPKCRVADGIFKSRSARCGQEGASSLCEDPVLSNEQVLCFTIIAGPGETINLLCKSMIAVMKSTIGYRVGNDPRGTERLSFYLKKILRNPWKMN